MMDNERNDHDELYEELNQIGEIDLNQEDEEESEGEARPIERPDIATTIQLIFKDDEDHISPAIFYGLSGLSMIELKQLGLVWETLPAAHRRKLILRMVEISESDYEMDYAGIGRFALRDSDPGVREAGIELLFEDMSISLMDQLIQMAQDDESREVRAAAVSALGRFILAGEIGDLPEYETVRAQETAISLLSDDDVEVEVRRRALEAIANCSHEVVEDAIKEAYTNYDRQMRVSALFAMGRSCDEQWAPILLRELESDDPEMRYEAARAAGEIEVPEAIPQLIRLAFDADREIKEVAIWSLGEIGGKDAQRALAKLARDTAAEEDEDLQEAIDEALANAYLVDDDFDIFDLNRDR